MLQEFKCRQCEHYKYMRGMHWCVKCNDEIRFQTKTLMGKGNLWIPRACYFNKYFSPKENDIPNTGLCCQVED